MSAQLHDPTRLAAIRRLALLDTPAEESFDRITRVASRALRAPIALVVFVTENRQFFKSMEGLPEPWASRQGTPLSHSFCQHVVTSRAPLVVIDARIHALVRDNLAIRDLDIIAYVSVPLITADGHTVGSLCAIDTKPHEWSETDLTLLTDLAALVMHEIAFRDLVKREVQLAHRASHDALTDLPNRTVFTERLADALIRTRHRQDTLAVLFLDMDGFKGVNDRFGHIVGDQLLVMVADRLRQSVRANDLVARFGGDEFMVLLPELETLDEAINATERIMSQLQAPYHLDGATVTVQVTVGIARNVSALDGAYDLIRDADAAMYRAKRLGRAQYELF